MYIMRYIAKKLAEVSSYGHRSPSPIGTKNATGTFLVPIGFDYWSTILHFKVNTKVKKHVQRSHLNKKINKIWSYKSIGYY